MKSPGIAANVATLIFAGGLCLALALPGGLFGQGEESFDAETGIEAPPAAGPATAVKAKPGVEEWVRSAKKRMSFAVANIFESRDIWRGIDWFVDDSPAYLLGGDFKLDLTPFEDRSKRDIWEVKLHSMVAGAYALESGHENIDRWKVMAVLENRIFKYLDLDIGYEHYGLPPFDDHDRDFEEIILRAGFNALPLFRGVRMPGYGKPITEIPFSVHYGAYAAFASKGFALTTDKYGFHGYPNSWWWHNIEFNLIVPFPDLMTEKSRGILQCLKLDSQIWLIDRPSVLPGLPDGLQDAEFGLALPLILDAGKWCGLDGPLYGVFGESKIIVEPFVRYALDAQNLDRDTRTWFNEDEIWGGVALVYAF